MRQRRGHDRLRGAGAGPDHELSFTDRVIATLVILRFQLPHAALAVFCRVDRFAITRGRARDPAAAGSARGRVPAKPGLRLKTVADVFAYAALRGASADRRHRGASPPAQGRAAGAAGVRVRQEETEHDHVAHLLVGAVACRVAVSSSGSTPPEAACDRQPWLQRASTATSELETVPVLLGQNRLIDEHHRVAVGIPDDLAAADRMATRIGFISSTRTLLASQGLPLRVVSQPSSRQSRRSRNLVTSPKRRTWSR